MDAHFEAFIGATGSGKTTRLKKRWPRRAKRTLIWSPKERKDNYAALHKGTVICRTAGEVLAVLSKAGKRKPFHIVVIPTLKRKQDEALFSIVCKMVLAVEKVIMGVDELHSVTRPSWAPEGWVQLCFMGRESGVWVFGSSQRPASVDKAFMGSLSYADVGRLPYDDDVKAMAKVIGVPAAEVAALLGYQSISRDMLTGEVVRNL